MVLIVYPLSWPIFYVIAELMPSWMRRYYIEAAVIYDPLEWLCEHVEWFNEIYSWYGRLFPLE